MKFMKKVLATCGGIFSGPSSSSSPPPSLQNYEPSSKNLTPASTATTGSGSKSRAQRLSRPFHRSTGSHVHHHDNDSHGNGLTNHEKEGLHSHSHSHTNTDSSSHKRHYFRHLHHNHNKRQDRENKEAVEHQPSNLGGSDFAIRDADLRRTTTTISCPGSTTTTRIDHDYFNQNDPTVVQMEHPMTFDTSLGNAFGVNN